jgi:two-component system OmpR family sensor kinase
MGADVLASHQNPRPRPWAGLRQLSDRTPLRTKLITAVLALVIMALAAISFTSVNLLRSYLTTEHDGHLLQIYQGIAADPVGNFGGLSTNIAYPIKYNPNMFAGIQQPGSQLSPQSSGPGLGGGNFGNPQQQSVPNVPTSMAWATANSGNLITLNAQSGPNTWRVIVTPVTIGNTSGTLVVGYDLGNINAEIRRLTEVDLVVSGAIIVVLAIAGVAVVRANLRPLDDIEMTAGEIAKGRLDHRVPERDPRTEIGSLGRSLNIMLSQIEAAFHAQEESEQAAHASEERMRRFIADASHELRTPLTTIRGFAEYYRQRGGVKNQNPLSGTDGGAAAQANGRSPGGLDPEDLDRLMQRLESEATRMGLLVEDLLQLARLDQQRPLDMAPVDLLTLAADAVQDARIVAPDRPIDLIVAPGAAFLVEGDEQRLRQVIANLVNNALTHTPPGTPVRVKVASGTLAPPGSGGQAAGPNAGSTAPRSGHPGPAVVLDVEDDGAGMTAEQAQRVFERFYRADQARNRASGGTGLGLAIVAGLVAAHGGTVSVRTAPGRGADFQVRLPLSPDAQVDEPDDEESQAGAC